jgi:hypothetical protein
MITLAPVCTHCGRACTLYLHNYYEGSLQRPTRTWQVLAPLCYIGNESFCSPACATSRMRSRGALPQPAADRHSMAARSP